jgi:multiple sugar transport system substrate-binding protein
LGYLSPSAEPATTGEGVLRLNALLATIGALAGAVVLAGCGGGAGSAGPPTLRWFIFDEPGGSFEDAAERCNREARGRYRIQLEILPANADDQRTQLVRRLAARDDSIDIIGLDLPFTAEFAGAGWIEEWTGARREEVTRGAIPSTVRSAELDGRLYAAPFTSNTQLLWYRKDRVPRPPGTWEEMIAMAERLGENGTIQVQGKQAEGLVVWFTSLLYSAGGKVLESQDQAALGPPAERAIAVMQRVASSSAADPSLPNSAEDEGRIAFQEGGSSFMVNYPFVLPSAKEEAPEVAKQMRAARYPDVQGGGPSSPPLGGINLAVGSYSQHPDLAFDAATCLRQPANQLIATESGGLPPTQESLYSNPVVEEAYPGFAPLMLESIRSAQPRPTTPAYSDISLAIRKSLHPPSELDPQEAAEELRDKVQQAIEARGVI